MIKEIGLFLLLVAGACIVGYIRGSFTKGPQAGSRPVDDPAGGFASPQQLRERLSEDAVRRAGTQVRPSIPQPQLRTSGKRKGVTRGRR